MALTESEVHGSNIYIFGYDSIDSPSELTAVGFTPRKAEAKYAPEVKASAINGEGHTEAIAMSLPAKRMISLTITGYIISTFNAATCPNGFTFKGRWFLIDDISVPRTKGEFTEVAITATSNVLVTS